MSDSSDSSEPGYYNLRYWGRVKKVGPKEKAEIKTYLETSVALFSNKEITNEFVSAFKRLDLPKGQIICKGGRAQEYFYILVKVE